MGDPRRGRFTVCLEYASDEELRGAARNATREEADRNMKA